MLFKQKTFFLYHESNYINHTFYKELNKNLQMYGLILTLPIGGIKTTNLTRPESGLKFRVVQNKYMDHIVLQLEDIRKPGKKKQRTQKLQIFQIYQQNLKKSRL